MKAYCNILQRGKNFGFTLIELLVVLAILAFILGTTAGMFLSFTKGQQRILKEQELLGQLSYALEYVPRLASTSIQDATGSCLGVGYGGYNYILTHKNASSGFYQGVKFLSGDNVCEEFFLDTDGLFKEAKGSSLPQNIISASLNVVYARFVLNGQKNLADSQLSDSTQPRLTFALDVKTKDAQNPIEKVVQATISRVGLIQ